MSDPQELRAQLAQKSRQLQEIAAQLKTELFSIDTIIDRVIDSMRAWYVLPELVSRPVIICLWGLTGTGKTQLVRRLAQLLGLYDRFVEVQMDGFSHGALWHGARKAEGRCGLRFEVAASVREQIYANAVFPAQGTRPLFSSLHAILGGGLAKAALWALECGASAGDRVALSADGRSLIAHWRDRSHTIAAPFEITRLRQRSNADFRALLAVHEAGHGSSGAESDLRKATETAARMLRHFGHGPRIGRTDVSVDRDDNVCTDVEASNAPIEALLQAEHLRATGLIETHRVALLALVNELMAHGQVTPARFAAVVALPLGSREDALDPYAERLEEFRAAAEARPGRAFPVARVVETSCSP